EDGIRAFHVTGVQTCALPISPSNKLVYLFNATSPLVRTSLNTSVTVLSISSICTVGLWSVISQLPISGLVIFCIFEIVCLFRLPLFPLDALEFLRPLLL